MVKHRPTSVLVIAILQLIGGGLGLLLGLYSLVVLLIGSSQMFATPPPPPGGGPANQQAREMYEFSKKMEDFANNPPGGKGLQYGTTALDLLLSLMMVSSGIGLISMHGWARTLAILYASLSILSHIGQAIYVFGFTAPAMRELMTDAPRGDPVISMMATWMEIAIIGAGILGLLFMIYPIIVLVFMLKSSNALAFRGEMHAGIASLPPDDYNAPFRPREGGASFRADEP